MASYLDPDNDPSLHRLEGSSGNQAGGLVIMKKKPVSDSDKHSFKKPSLLGLDKLAAAKRQSEIAVENVRKKSKVTSYRDDFDEDSSESDDEDENDSRQPNKGKKKER